MNIDQLMDSLTRDEKIALVSGADQWHTKGLPHLNIPAIMVADGPHGLRKQDAQGDRLGIGDSKAATCFPAAATSANAWDPDLQYAMGQAIGEEALQEGVAVVLGPGVNIKRSPLCGRNFEYFSEDPWLTGELATAWIKGIQAVGVGACIKHFAANNQERWRMLNDSLVDERALREIYLAAFEKAVREAQPWTVMPAYNKLNGMYCCENPELLDSILRKEWGFTGATISDWGAVNDPTLSIKAGLDLEMPASWGTSAAQVRQDLSSGRLTEEELDRSVKRVLELVMRSKAQKQKSNCDLEAHHALARRIASESAVLLKNEDNILPLAQTQSICVVGQFAEHPRYQGTGSSLIHPTRLDTVLGLLESGEVEVDYTYAKGYELEHDGINEVLISEACEAAAKADVAVIFAGLTPRFESEGYDRTHLDLPPSHQELISRVAQANPNVVVVLSAGAPVTMPWLDKVKGVLHTYLGGQGGAGASLDLLYGKINPSGKLAESYPLKLDDCLAMEHFAEDRNYTEYRESIFVGYRYYDAAEKDVLFPFGFGLSYTEFAYEDLVLSKHGEPETLHVQCTVRNIGSRAGAEVVQLYVGKSDSVLFRAVRELKGFHKIHLEPGESRKVEFVLGGRAFAYYNVEIGDWHVEPGEYQISVGTSSRNLPLSGTVQIESRLSEVKVPDYRASIPAYYHLNDANTRISQADFQTLYNREYPQAYQGPERFHNNSTLQDLGVTLLGRLVLAFAKRYLWKMTGAKDENDPLWIMSWTSTLEMPLRSIVPMSGGAIPARFVRGLLSWVNGHRLKALRMWIFS